MDPENFLEEIAAEFLHDYLDHRPSTYRQQLREEALEDGYDEYEQ